jgi:hypothetical protein
MPTILVDVYSVSVSPVVRLARKLYQAELPPDRLLSTKNHNLCVSLISNELPQFLLWKLGQEACSLLMLCFIAVKLYSKVKYLNCEGYSITRSIQSSN